MSIGGPQCISKSFGAVRGVHRTPGARLAAALALAFPIVTLSACGGGGDAPAQPSAAAAAPAPLPAAAADAQNGKALYQRNCSVCHGPSPDPRPLSVAGDGPAILQTIGLIRTMNFLSASVGPAEAADIALWLQDPR